MFFKGKEVGIYPAIKPIFRVFCQPNSMRQFMAAVSQFGIY